MFRVKRFAAANMIEAGTIAPMEMAAKEKPANHEGNSFAIRAGTMPLAPQALRGVTRNELSWCSSGDAD